MATDIKPPLRRSRFRAPDGEILERAGARGSAPTHAILCQRASKRGWFVTRTYASRAAAEEECEKQRAIWREAGVDCVIVEGEPI